jgi:CRP-like cAMP-binding protein
VGEVDVSIGGDVVARLVSGDFFGELAALDCGAGFGYPRLATVAATTPVRLLVLPERTLSFAMRLVPRLDREVRARFAERRRTR